MPPACGELTVDLRIVQQRSRLLRGVGRVVPICVVLQADRASVQVCATQTPRPPTMRREENRMKNFNWVILFGHSQTNFDSQNGRKETKMNQKQYHSLEELPLMMNLTDVAAVLGISRAGAYKLAHSADFPAFQIGKRIAVSREKFLDWLDRQCEEQKCA